MEVLSFIDPDGNKLYCVGPFRERSQASRAASATERSSAAPSQRERGAITKRCRQIFDLLDGRPRKTLIAEAARQGINSGTAATQYQRWKKAKELGRDGASS